MLSVLETLSNAQVVELLPLLLAVAKYSMTVLATEPPAASSSAEIDTGGDFTNEELF